MTAQPKRRPGPPPSGPHVSRRDLIATAGTAAVVAAGLAAALAACGSGGASGNDSGNGNAAGNSDTAENGNGPGDRTADLGATKTIPEGGGKVFEERKVVVTQPRAGEFKAFSAVCRHQGCIVHDVSGGTINCACHGSKYAITDGGVRRGPATRPLPEQRLSVKDGELRLGSG